MTFGCQQNEADSERIAGMLRDMGYEIFDMPRDCVVIIVNTCAIREHAELKALSKTGQLKHVKRDNPAAVIGMCGCMVQQEHRKEDIKHKFPYVNFVFGTHMLHRFPEILMGALEGEKRRFEVEDSEGYIAEGLPVRRSSPFKASVTIMYGCDNFCSYCVVPYVRGRERSRDRTQVLEEIRGLVQSGCKDILLLGQNVNSYSDGTFASLLEEVCAIEGDFIVRFMTSHPKDASNELIDVIGQNEKIERHFHLPLQSGSNDILKAMNRGYTREYYYSLVEKLRTAAPSIALTTDIIVGFPGETNCDFEDTLELVDRVGFDNMYTFNFSPRKGTPANDLLLQVPPEVKEERFSRLLELQNKKSMEKNNECVGKVLRVLAEGEDKSCRGLLTGRTSGGKLVHFASDTARIGSFVRVKIDKASLHSLNGTVIE
ncbi:MAG: tRNA (N6-isopentenyl adenosine(37)-C2)-methylthiotransferase MiaB [Eubacteriales bacterium]